MKIFAGFLMAASAAVWCLSKSPQLLAPLLILIAYATGIFLFAAIVWYGLVQLRTWFRI